MTPPSLRLTCFSCRNDISACLEWLYAAGKQPSDIILYGQSVGSGPSVYLAAVTQDIAGVILHSALASGNSSQLTLINSCTFLTACQLLDLISEMMNE